MAEYQSRYVAYARAHGAMPAEMLERDRERWPGGVMCGFILWIGRQWKAWAAEAGESLEIRDEAKHNRFDAWLAERESEEKAA